MARDGCIERKSLDSGEPVMHGVTVSNRQDIGASPLVFHHIYISISTPSLPPRKALLIHSNDFIGRMMPMINWPSSCFSTDFTAGDVGVEKSGFSSLEHTMRETTLYQPGVCAMWEFFAISTELWYWQLHPSYSFVWKLSFRCWKITDKPFIAGSFVVLQNLAQPELWLCKLIEAHDSGNDAVASLKVSIAETFFCFSIWFTQRGLGRLEFIGAYNTGNDAVANLKEMIAQSLTLLRGVPPAYSCGDRRVVNGYSGWRSWNFGFEWVHIWSLWESFQVLYCRKRRPNGVHRSTQHWKRRCCEFKSNHLTVSEIFLKSPFGVRWCLLFISGSSDSFKTSDELLGTILTRPSTSQYRDHWRGQSHWSCGREGEELTFLFVG